MIDTAVSSKHLVLGRTLFVLNGRVMRCERMFVDISSDKPIVSFEAYLKGDKGARYKKHLKLDSMLMTKATRPSGRTVIYFRDFNRALEFRAEIYQLPPAQQLTNFSKVCFDAQSTGGGGQSNANSMTWGEFKAMIDNMIADELLANQNVVDEVFVNYIDVREPNGGKSDLGVEVYIDRDDHGRATIVIQN